MATRKAARVATRMSSSKVAAESKHVVVLGGGIQGASAAYHIAKRGAKVTLVELEGVGSAASGKAGGFLARDWGSGSTARLHTESFRMHKELSEELGLETFREINTLSVASGRSGQKKGLKLTAWLDGEISEAKLLDTNTAQVTPMEITSKLAEAATDKYGAEIVLGRATGVVCNEDETAVEAVRVEIEGQEKVLECSDILVSSVLSLSLSLSLSLPQHTFF